MQIARVIYPVKTLGPGERLVIWTVGCSKKCENCISKELWEKEENKELDISAFFTSLLKTIEGKVIDGITISGGDPLEQKDELLKLLPKLKGISDDILLYTGYTHKEITDNLDNNELKLLKENVSVLIEGRYINELNDNQCVLRGSTNQKILFFNQEIEDKYKTYIDGKRTIQNFYMNEGLISVGIHNK